MKPFDIILADPPWWYNNRKTGGERKPKISIDLSDKDPKFGGGARKHYSLMRDDALLQLAPLIKQISNNNSACFIWCTKPRKDFGIELLKAWGFEFVTEPYALFKLSKDGTRFIFGPGSYTGTNSEDVILGVRGKYMTPEAWDGQRLQKSILTPRLDHSVKPPIHRLLHKLYPGARKIELFSRKKRYGSHYKTWYYAGNEMSGMDIKDELQFLSNQIKGFYQPTLWEDSYGMV